MLRSRVTLAQAALLLAVVVSLIFLYSPGTFDVKTWLDVRWLPRAERLGLIRGYERAHDNYPPLSFVVIGWVGIVARALGVERFLIFKLTLFVFLLATTLATYRVTRSVWVAACMHALLTVSAMMQGYIDIFYGPALVLTFGLLRADQRAAASGVFVLGALMKYQPLIMAPALTLHALADSLSPLSWRMLAKRLTAITWPACLLLLVVGTIFGPWTLGSLFAATAGHDWLSANALNFNWLVASALSPDDPLSVHMQPGLLWKLPRVLFAAGYALSLTWYWRSRRDVTSCLVSASLGYLSYFMFNPGVHENHLFPAAITCTLAVAADPARFAVLAYWPIAAILNHLLFYGFTGEGFPYRRDIAGVDLTVLFATLNVLAYGHAMWTLAVCQRRALRPNDGLQIPVARAREALRQPSHVGERKAAAQD